MRRAEFQSDWQAFTSGVLASGPGSVSHAHVMRWQMALPSMAKPVLLLDGAPRREPLAGFLRKDWQRWVARLWTALPAVLRVACAPISTPLAQTQRAMAYLLPRDVSAQPTALYFGSRGPLQKVTVLLRSAQGESWVSKIALRASADHAILNEVHWLARLATFPRLATSVPALVSHGRLETGRAFLTTRAWPIRTTTGQFTDRHAEFLEALCSTTLQWCPWDTGAGAARLQDRLRQLRAGRHRTALHENLERAARALQGDPSAALPFPSCLAHGDFAPWNLGEDESDGLALRVFDWEYAHEGASPLTDLFHFLLAQAVLEGRPGDLGRAFVERVVLPVARRQLTRLPQLAGLEEGWILWALRLYLVDTLTFYLLNSSDPGQEHRLVSAYAALLQALETEA